jgi:hypothetical protein
MSFGSLSAQAKDALGRGATLAGTSTTTGDGGTDDLALSGTGRYVRLTGTARAKAYGYSLWEFALAGTPQAATGDTLLSQGRPALASSTGAACAVSAASKAVRARAERSRRTGVMAASRWKRTFLPFPRTKNGQRVP